jgi:hypothetical protein
VGAIETKSAIGGQSFFTEYDRAGAARLRFGLLVAVAALATVLLADVPDAQNTIHAAGSYHIGIHAIPNFMYYQSSVTIR